MQDNMSRQDYPSDDDESFTSAKSQHGDHDHDHDDTPAKSTTESETQTATKFSPEEEKVREQPPLSRTSIPHHDPR